MERKGKGSLEKRRDGWPGLSPQIEVLGGAVQSETGARGTECTAKV